MLGADETRVDSERWEPIGAEGYGDYYQISDLGRLRRSAPGLGTRPGKVRALSLGHRSHPVVKLSAGGITRSFAVAPLVAAAFLSPKPPGAILKHRDGDRSHGAAANLYWATRTASWAGWRSDLTTAQVAEVLALREWLSGRAVARRYGVSVSTIDAIWKQGEGLGRRRIPAPRPPHPA